MSYNRNFELDVRDIELIEQGLNTKLNKLLTQRQTHIESTIKPVHELDSVKQIDAAVKEIRDLLGRIHNQKIWYRPKDDIYISG
jgi:hypothetical protein